MNGQGMWETKKKKSHKKRRKQKHIDILNEPPRLKSTFYKDLNRGPKNIWKLQTIKWWDPVTQVPTFPTGVGLGRNQVPKPGGVVITNEVLKCGIW